MLKLQLSGAPNPLLQQVSGGSTAPVPPDGVNPGTLKRAATAAEKKRYYDEGWRGGDQGAGSACRKVVAGVHLSRACTHTPDVLGFFQPSVEMTATTSGKWNSGELSKVRAGTKDFGRQGDKEAWRIFFTDDGRNLRYEYKPRDYGSGITGTLTSPLSSIGHKVLAPIAKAGGSAVEWAADLVCAASGSQAIQDGGAYASGQYGASYGKDAASQQANAAIMTNQYAAGAKIAGAVACKIAGNGGSGAQAVPQPQMVSYYRPSNKKWYTWSISGGGSLSGVRICGAGQLCGPLAGVTLSELESKANAIGAQFVSATDNLPQGARNAGEIQESWYRSWWGLGLIAVGVGAVGYYGFKKRK